MQVYKLLMKFLFLGIFALGKLAYTHDDPAVFPLEISLKLAKLIKEKKVAFCECRAIEGFGENPVVRLERGVVGSTQQKILDRCLGNFKKESIDQIELVRCDEL
jgi:hypothetical protein